MKPKKSAKIEEKTPKNTTIISVGYRQYLFTLDAERKIYSEKEPIKYLVYVKKCLLDFPEEVLLSIEELHILNPNEFEISTDTKNTFSDEIDHKTKKEKKIKSLFESCLILNKDRITFDEDLFEPGKNKIFIDTIDFCEYKIHSEQKIIFFGSHVDEFSLKLLEKHNILEGYRETFFEEYRIQSNLNVSSIIDTTNYLRFVKNRFVNREYFAPRGFYSIYDGIKYEYSEKTISELFCDLLISPKSRIIFECDDDLIINSLIIPLKEIYSNILHIDWKKEFFRNMNEFEVITGVIDEAKPNLIYNLCKALNDNESKVPIFIFSKTKIVKISELGFDIVYLPSIKNNNLLKQRLLLTLLWFEKKWFTEISIYYSEGSILSSFNSGNEIARLIQEHRIDLEKWENRDFWYDLKLKYEPKELQKNIIEHIIEEGIWKVTSSKLNDPIKIKYYPNKCFMYLAYLMKTAPAEKSALKLRNTIDDWISMYLNTHQSVKPSTRKNKSKDLSKISGPKTLAKKPKKTAIEVAYDSIKESIRNFKKKLPKNLSEEEIKYIHDLFNKKRIHIGKNCSAKLEQVTNYEINDPFLEKIINTK